MEKSFFDKLANLPRFMAIFAEVCGWDGELDFVGFRFGGYRMN